MYDDGRAVCRMRDLANAAGASVDERWKNGTGRRSVPVVVALSLVETPRASCWGTESMLVTSVAPTGATAPRSQQIRRADRCARKEQPRSGSAPKTAAAVEIGIPSRHCAKRRARATLKGRRRVVTNGPTPSSLGQHNLPEFRTACRLRQRVHAARGHASGIGSRDPRWARPWWCTDYV